MGRSKSLGPEAVVSCRAHVGETDAEVQQARVLLGSVQAIRYARGEEHTPEAIAGMGVVVSGMPRSERRVVPAEQEVEARLQEVYGHRA